MTERPLPEEAIRPNQLRIFSGAKVKDGKYVNPVHQTLFDLWQYERSWGRVPGILTITPTEGSSDIEKKESFSITPQEKNDIPLLEDMRGRFERGVSNWVMEGSESYNNIAEFRERYITPLEEQH